jgi:XTP/dITP diphosphohydrolase
MTAPAPHPCCPPGHSRPLHVLRPSLPSLLAAEKVLARWDRTGRGPLPESDDLGSRMLALVAQARAEGRDADAELRAALGRLADE